MEQKPDRRHRSAPTGGEILCNPCPRRLSAPLFGFNSQHRRDLPQHDSRIIWQHEYLFAELNGCMTARSEASHRSRFSSIRSSGSLFGKNIPGGIAASCQISMADCPDLLKRKNLDFFKVKNNKGSARLEAANGANKNLKPISLWPSWGIFPRIRISGALPSLPKVLIPITRNHKRS